MFIVRKDVMGTTSTPGVTSKTVTQNLSRTLSLTLALALILVLALGLALALALALALPLTQRRQRAHLDAVHERRVACLPPVTQVLTQLPAPAQRRVVPQRRTQRLHKLAGVRCQGSGLTDAWLHDGESAGHKRA